MKTKYFTTHERIDKDIKERIKKIPTDVGRVFARSNLHEAFRQLKYYEEFFRDFNKDIKEGILNRPDAKIVGYEFIKSTFNAEEKSSCEEYYKEQIEGARKWEADVSNIPDKLNYLERLN